MKTPTRHELNQVFQSALALGTPAAVAVKKPTRQEVEQVFQAGRALGKAAFEAGKVCTPALDSELRALMAAEPYQIGDKRCIARLDGWLRGWAEANVAAPVEV
jgi:hypothetical protein